MRAGRFVVMSVAVAFALAPSLRGQFGPPEPTGSGPKLSKPTSFPAPGVFPTTESVTLLDADPHATIHYTFDGSDPRASSPVFDPQHLLFIAGVYDGNHGLKTGYTIRAIAIEAGHTNSDIANFQFTIDRRDHTQYVSEEILPGVRMIRDSDNDKMLLLHGRGKYVLIDSGMGRGALRQYVQQFTGGLPITVIFTHNHGDHIGQADQFIQDSTEYIGAPDRAGLVQLLKARGASDDLIARHVVDVHDGDRIDLGDRSLEIYSVPGHTPGSIVIFDRKNGYLFSGDSFGSNSPTIPDAAWLIFDPHPLDQYLAAVERCRSHLGGQVRYMMTGHNDHPLEGETYLNNLEKALHLLLEKGNAVLVPSFRPPGFSQVIVGDRMHDPNWVAINVNVRTYLPAHSTGSN